METSNLPFGLIVAYVLPGFIGLGGLMLFVPAMREWLQPVSYQGAAAVAPSIYAVLAAITVGMIISCFRWLFIDHILAWTGIKTPTWNANELHQKLDAFNYFVQHHYRYYQFYANTLIAVIWTYAVNRIAGTLPLAGPATDLGIVILCFVLFAGSRDALAKYYDRTGSFLGEVAEKEH